MGDSHTPRVALPTFAVRTRACPRASALQIEFGELVYVRYTRGEATRLQLKNETGQLIRMQKTSPKNPKGDPDPRKFSNVKFCGFSYLFFISICMNYVHMYTCIFYGSANKRQTQIKPEKEPEILTIYVCS